MTEEKREKVINGMECHLGNDRNHYDCDNCQYGPMNDECDAKLVADALALLNAQEPRVMTLDEVLAAEVVYVEDIDKAEIIPVLVDRRAHDRIVLVRSRLMGSPSLTIYPLISEYGKRWRCWTSRPTEAEREAVKWE